MNFIKNIKFNWRIFFILIGITAVLFASGVVFPLIAIILFLPLLFLINIPAWAIHFITFGHDGFLFDFKEFGAMPTTAGWATVVLFWLAIIFLISLRRNKSS